jgi:hypothetical protein
MTMRKELERIMGAPYAELKQGLVYKAYIRYNMYTFIHIRRYL